LEKIKIYTFNTRIGVFIFKIVLALLPMLAETYNTKQFYSDKLAVNGDCLSMVLGGKCFMYAISSGDFTIVSELCHVEINAAPLQGNMHDTIVFLINNYQLTQKKFEKVNIVILNHHFTLVPDAYADVESLKPLMQFTGGGPVKTVLRHHVKDLQFCYALQPDTGPFLERTFPNASIRHGGAVTISLLFSHHSLELHDLFLNLGDGFIEIASRRGGELLFYNLFFCESDEDILYYLLFMMEQFNLDPSLVRLGIACQRPVNDGLILNLQKYIRHVQFCVTDPSVRVKGELLSLPQHYYFTLLNQHLCAL
jgi:hypothetical protein